MRRWTRPGLMNCARSKAVSPDMRSAFLKEVVAPLWRNAARTVERSRAERCREKWTPVPAERATRQEPRNIAGGSAFSCVEQNFLAARGPTEDEQIDSPIRRRRVGGDRRL